MKKLKLINKLHHSTKRNYLKRMTDNKINCMKIAKKYEFDYWDGNRKYGYEVINLYQADGHLLRKK